MNQAVQAAVRQSLKGNGHDVQRLLCSRPGCVGTARWRVHARVWPRGAEHRSDNYVAVRFPLVVCDGCKETTTVADIVDNNGWRQIVQVVKLRHKAKPDRSSLWLYFQPVIPMVRS